MTSARRAREVCQELEEHARSLAELLPGQVRRAAIPSGFDGFPSSTVGVGRGGGAVDTMAQRVAGQVDADEGEPDPVAEAVAMAVTELHAGAARIRRAVDFALRAQRIQTPDRPSVAADPSQGCCNCARFELHGKKIWSAVYKAGRCAACYGYRRRNDLRDRPERLVVAAAAGRRTFVAVDDVA